MKDEREDIGLPSSLVNEAIGSMNTDSQIASNSPIVHNEGDSQVPMDIPQPENNFEKVDSNDIMQKIDTLDPYRGSNVDRQSSFDQSSPVENFDSSNFNLNESLNNGLLGDTRGSTVPQMEQPVMAEQVGQIDFVKWFSELNNNDVPIAGGKGASLGEMFSNKFPVPPGYVITAQAYDYYLKNSGIKEKIAEIINSVDVDDTAALNESSKKVRQLIEGGNMPNDLKEEILESYKILSSEDLGEISPGVSNDALSILKNSQEPIFVSVRSSATTEDLKEASFAGQQESFLNVKGETNLIEHIKKCFSSLYTPRAIFYRKKKGFSGALIAVVIQKMIDSEKSGVVFSRDPVKMEDNIAMEAVFGLGEGIVSGKIHPDNYLVDRELEVKKIKVANKKIAIVRNSSGDNEIVRLSPEKSESQVMSRAEIKEVADFALKLEAHYEKPQDIEFAIEAGEVYIIQSRPITTLASKKEAKELEGTILVEGLAASPGIGVGNVKIVNSMDDLVNIKKGDVMVTEMTNPDMVVSMQKSVAIVTDEGGMTSHAAIVSREMGIPAIVGTSDATKKLKDGSRVTVDGFNGKVFEGEVAKTTMAEIKEVVQTNKIKMKVIVDLPDYANRAAKSGIDSVGLTRLEGMIASMGKHPLWYEKHNKLLDYSKILQEGLTKIIAPFNSVWVRASDIRTDEFANLEGAPEREINPMLGFHGVRFSVKHPEILRAEIAAIKEVAEHNPDKKIGLMFPQIISMEEVLAVKKYFNEFRTDNMEFGVMIETPAAVQIIEDICDHVDFISFGTNDLTQFTLAVDRGEDTVQHLYNELHPAIFSQIGHVIDVCNRKNVVSSICGQAGSKPEMAKFLYEKGIKSISVNADAAYEISVVIRDLENADAGQHGDLEKVGDSDSVNENIEKSNGENQLEPVVKETPMVVDTMELEKPSTQEPIIEAKPEQPKEDWGTKGQISVADVAPNAEEIHEGPVAEVQKENVKNHVEEPSVSQPVVEGSSSPQNNNELNEEERKAIKKKKKWEKFMKWKERKKAEKAAKRAAGGNNNETQKVVGDNNVLESEVVEENNRDEKPIEENTAQEKPIEENNNNWGKQGEMALPDSGNHQVVEQEEKMEVDENDNISNDSDRAKETERQEVVQQVRNDEKQFNEEVQEENPYEDNLLNPENIDVSAEVSQVHRDIKGVSEVDDMHHVQEVAKEIVKDVKEHNEELIEKKHEAIDRIEVEIEKPDEIKENQELEKIEDKMERLTDDDVEEKTVSEYVDQDEPNVPEAPIQTNEEKEVIEQVQEIVGEEESRNSEDQAYGETPSEYSSESFEVKEEIEKEAEEIRGENGDERSNFEENNEKDESNENQESGDNNNDSDESNEVESNEVESTDNENNSEESSDKDGLDNGVGGDGGEEFSEMGVYNPNEGEEKSEEKSKYKYNFDSWDEF